MEIENLKHEVQILRGIIGKLLIIINRLLLDDEDENTLRVAAMITDIKDVK
jgi:hypothetical protein